MMAKRDGKDVRVLFKIGDTLRSFARFVIHKGDGSFYIIPFAKNSIYRGGVQELGNTLRTFETKVEFLTGREAVDAIPHISLHETGRVRVHTHGGVMFGDLVAKPLAQLNDEHIASLVVDSEESLPIFEGETQTDVSKVQYDLIVPIEDFSKPITFPIWVNAKADVFRGPGELLTAHISRADGAGVNHFRVGSLRRPIKYEEAHEPGIVAITGWDVGKMDAGESEKFIFLVGK